MSFAHVGEQCAGRRNAQRLVGATETGQIAGAELFGEGASGGLRVEMPGWSRSPGPILEAGGLCEEALVIGRQQFSGPQPLDLRLEGGEAGQLHDAEAAGGSTKYAADQRYENQAGQDHRAITTTTAMAAVVFMTPPG